MVRFPVFVAASLLFILKDANAGGNCSFSPVLGNNMVLQRDAPARVWGNALPGARVALTLVPSTGIHEFYSTQASESGDWSIDMKARSVDIKPNTILLECNEMPTVNLTNVLFGDVFGCHGQSNMVFGLGQDMNATEECANAGSFPLLRFTTYTLQPWSVASPKTACTGTGFSPISAVCWYFGKNIFLQLNSSVPIGLVSSNVGGTAVELWSGPDAIKRCDQTQVVKQSTLWTPLILPLTPMQISGWIWYQGESNVACSPTWPWIPGTNCAIGCPDPTRSKNCTASAEKCADYYSCQFPAMVQDWREKWNGGNDHIAGRPVGPKPFIYVVLAPYTEGVGEPGNPSVAFIREAQYTANKLPNVGFATAIDYGDTRSPLGNIHPRYKSIVGQRLADTGMAKVYGVAQDPPYPEALYAWYTYGKVHVAFSTPVRIVEPVLGVCPVFKTSCAWLSVDGENVTFHVDTQNASIVTASVSAKAPPKVIQYLFGDWPVPTIYSLSASKWKFPASPFRLSISPPNAKYDI